MGKPYVDPFTGCPLVTVKAHRGQVPTAALSVVIPETHFTWNEGQVVVLLPRELDRIIARAREMDPEVTGMSVDRGNPTCQQRVQYNAGPNCCRAPWPTRLCGKLATMIIDGVALCSQHGLRELECETEGSDSHDQPLRP